MAKEKDRNYISVLRWMLIMLLTTIPCIGIPFAIVGALLGDNETRKNYCRALLVWGVLALLAWIVIVALGLAPQIFARIRSLAR